MKWFTLRIPDPLTLLVFCVVVAAALSYVLPAGAYQRREDPRTGRAVVVAGTYTPVESRPVGFFDAIVAIPRGMANAADVVFLILFGSAAFTVVDRTGALATGVSWLVARLGHRRVLVIPIVSLFFATGGVLENMQEEIIALTPVLVLLSRRLGFTPVTAVAMSLGAAFVGAAFSPINPFQVVIAQQVADVPRLSGWAFRTAFLVLALIVWIAATIRYAIRTQQSPAHDASHDPAVVAPADVTRHLIVLVVVVITFALLAWGMLFQGWDFDHLTALFFLMGVAAGLIGRLGFGGTARAFGEGFREMSLAAVLVGVARAIFVVLQDGRIVDTIVHGLFTPIEDLPRAFAGIAMMAAHMGLHLAVPSVSGQAVLTMPIMAPLADLLGMSRQIAVLAYQYGAGTTDMITPTNGALMAVLGAAGVGYDEWFRFAAPWFALLAGLGAVGLVVALAIGLQ
ncbi:MAG TPA: Na+/H+ antiporter NhaC family protein [Vicinamibacterales bacterium]|nr:Na+/H+ antiporter NhaC family protein [Vicinamibacterales bacterium]